MKVKFIQIAAAGDHYDTDLFALDQEGRVWIRKNCEWVLLEAPDDDGI